MEVEGEQRQGLGSSLEYEDKERGHFVTRKAEIHAPAREAHPEDLEM